MKRRILSLILVLSLLIGAAVRPQRADAVALTATVVAASAAAVLTACGVTYWAASQTDAVNYISGKIDDYLTSIGENEITYDEWLELNATSNIFDVVSGGVMQFSSGVANKLLDFCRWLQNDEGIESGGESVVDGITQIQDQPITVYSNSPPTWENIKQDGYLLGYNERDGQPYYGHGIASSVSDTYACVVGGYIYFAANTSGICYHLYNYLEFANANSNSYTMKYNSTYDVYSYVEYIQSNTPTVWYVPRYSTEVEAYTALSTVLHDGNVVKSVEITPSDFVNVPANIASGETFAVTPSVSLVSGDSVDTATEAILDGITSEEGLSSTVEDTPGTSWGWLYTLLVNIAEAITDGVADIKQAVLGLADSIYSKFTTVLQDIKTGITTIVNSITSAVSQLLSAIQALPTTIYSQFTQILQDIKTGIQGIALDIYTDVINALTYVFVPSQTFIDTYVASLYATFDNHFSILSYPFSILGEFITRASGIGSPEPMFTWGNIYEPFSGKLLIAAGSYNLNSMLSNQTFAQVYSIYMIVVKGLISFAFLKFLYSWFCDVFKMREDDFSSPLDVED